jgi:hypothetical protein
LYDSGKVKKVAIRGKKSLRKERKDITSLLVSHKNANFATCKYSHAPLHWDIFTADKRERKRKTEQIPNQEKQDLYQRIPFALPAK